MTIGQAQQELTKSLKTVYDDAEAANISDLVIENITGYTRANRLMHKDEVFTESQSSLLRSYKEQLLLNKPIQYVLNESWFANMKLFVDERVLIPRPETEELVDWIIKDTHKTKDFKDLSVIDIGTGSGCIPLALKKSIASAQVHAIDISEGALQVARKNAVQQSLDIHFSQINILSDKERSILGAFDVVVSNPPYIPLRDKDSMRLNVLDHEPWLALFVENDDPLCFYKAIATFGLSHLKENGKLYVEIHEELADAVKEVFKAEGYQHIEWRKDMQGKDRMIKASRVLF